MSQLTDEGREIMDVIEVRERHIRAALDRAFESLESQDYAELVALLSGALRDAQYAARLRDDLDNI